MAGLVGNSCAVLPVESRLAYYEALEADHVDGRREPFVEMVAGIVKQSFRLYYEALSLAWAE